MILAEGSRERLQYQLDYLLKESDKLRSHALEKDPIGLIYRYSNRLDQEASGFIAATLSYGKQSTFRPIIKTILEDMGESPASYLVESNPETWCSRLAWFKYRFNVPEDVAYLFFTLRLVYQKEGSLEFLFKKSLKDDIKEAASVFIKTLACRNFAQVHGSDTEYFPKFLATRGFNYLIPNPISGSACKRLNMFLRWMIRKDDIDLGNWTNIPPSNLVIPLDTHIARISKNIGLTTKTGGTWKVAEDITDSLRQLCPLDPLKYDFPLCTAGILRSL